MASEREIALDKRIVVLEEHIVCLEEPITNLKDLVAKLIADNAKLLDDNEKLLIENKKLLIENKKLLTENAELKRSLGMDSNNSSKPPSSDGFKYKPKPKSLRKTGIKKNGGQIGHTGKTLLMSDKPDEVVILKAKVCSRCHADISELIPVRAERAQVVDIPKPMAITTEYRKETTVCLCGQINCGNFPEDVSAGAQYGKNIKALIAYLNVAQFIPLERCCEVLREITDLDLCDATVLSALSDVEHKILPLEETIRENLLKSPVDNTDETGLRINGKLNWLHVVSNKYWTLYAVHTKRGLKAVEDIDLLTRFDGILEHDFYKSYLKLNVKHAFCCAHLMRECQGITDNNKQKWSVEMKSFLSDIWEKVKSFRKTGKRFSLNEIYSIYKEYDGIVNGGLSENVNVELGKRGGRPKPLCLLERFRDYKKSILRFVYNPDVPFDNNQAERDIRMVKVKAKVSGGFRTLSGAVQFARIRGFISTLRKQNRNVLRSLSNVLAGRFSWNG